MFVLRKNTVCVAVTAVAGDNSRAVRSLNFVDDFRKNVQRWQAECGKDYSQVLGLVSPARDADNHTLNDVVCLR